MSTHENHNGAEVEPEKTYLFCGEVVSLIPTTDTWEDGSLYVYGYYTGEPFDVELFGEEIYADLYFIPANAPTRINPFATDENPVDWLIGLDARSKPVREYNLRVGLLIRKMFAPDYPIPDNFDSAKFGAFMRAYSECLEKNCSQADFVSAMAVEFARAADAVRGVKLSAERANPDEPYVLLLAYWLGLCELYAGLSYDDVDTVAVTSYMEGLNKFKEALLAQWESCSPSVEGDFVASPEGRSAIKSIKAELREMTQNPLPETNARQLELLFGIFDSPAAAMPERMLYARLLENFIHSSCQMLSAAVDTALAEYRQLPDFTEYLPLASRQLEWIKGSDRGRIEAEAPKHGLKGPIYPQSLEIVVQKKDDDFITYAVLFCADSESESDLLVHFTEDQITHSELQSR